MKGKAYKEKLDMILDEKITDLKLTIGDVEKVVKIHISTGVVENDLFTM